MSNILFATKAYAHEEVVHETAVESGMHTIELLSPILSLAIYIAGALLLYLLLKVLKKSASVGALAMIVYTFVTAIYGLIFAPTLGIIATIIGFVLAIVLVFAGITSGNNEPHE